jgi:hypothetical protein
VRTHFRDGLCAALRERLQRTGRSSGKPLHNGMREDSLPGAVSLDAIAEGAELVGEQRAGQDIYVDKSIAGNAGRKTAVLRDESV